MARSNRAPFLNSLYLPCGVTEAGVGFGVPPRLKTILTTDFAEHLRLTESFSF
jgi:hypothetical protein